MKYLTISIIVIVLFVILDITARTKELSKKDTKKTNKEKGDEGEETAKETFKKILNKRDWHVINNVTLRKDIGTTQIDHILVSGKGVFVIETKNNKGRIYANKYRKEWTIYLGQNKIKMPNALHQNYGHTETLKKYIPKIKEKLIYSFVLFTNENCTLNKDSPENVIKIEELKRHLITIKSKMKKEDFYYCIGAIEFEKEKGENVDRMHIDHLNYRFKKKKTSTKRKEPRF